MLVRLIIILLSLIICRVTVFSQDIYKELRNKMVIEQIEQRGITNETTLMAIRRVPRHLFVPEKMIPFAYEDRPLSIGYGQTISQPFIVAYMTSILNLSRSFRVLEVGTGSGYQAAVLAEIIDTVYTIEIIPELARNAAIKFRELAYNNIICRQGDGFYGWPSNSPFDVVIVTAAVEEIPAPLIQQLKDGGKMIIPVGSGNLPQYLMLINKKNQKITREKLIPVRFVPFLRE
jgi:protein-L-isoaspartate(D-aspartate) O-methyltransferase